MDSRSVRHATLAITLGFATVTCVLAPSACGSGLPPPRPWTRDLGRAPIVVTADAVDTIYAVSDVHGGYERLVALLARHGVLASAPAVPDAAVWAAGPATLVIVGDVIDKGPQPIEVIDLLRTLEPQARAAGGRVVMTLGNHEAEWLAAPDNDKASKSNGIDHELRAMGLDPDVASTTDDPRGRWLGDRPFAARIGSWFFAHAGSTSGATIDSLSAAIAQVLPTNGFADASIIGDGSILEARDWWSDPSVVSSDLAAVGAKHFVVGHDPHALGPDGSIAVGQAGAIFRIDCGMSPDVDYGSGQLLRIRHTATEDVAEALGSDGSVTEIWRGGA
jgi:hypothetical protein